MNRALRGAPRSREMRLEEQVRSCRVCGCTDMDACETDDGPCHWVAADLCSACVNPGAIALAEQMEARRLRSEMPSLVRRAL